MTTIGAAAVTPFRGADGSEGWMLADAEGATRVLDACWDSEVAACGSNSRVDGDSWYGR